MFADFRLNVFLPACGNDRRADTSLTLQHSHNDHLAFGTTATNALFPFAGVHVASFSANEGFVSFNLSAEQNACALLHRPADTLEHEPCGFLRYLHVAGDLVGTDAILAVRNQPDSRQPLIQADRRVFKDGPDLDGELLAALPVLTFPDSSAFQESNGFRIAVMAGDAIGPTNRDQVAESVVSVREESNGFHEARGRLHTRIVP